MSIFIPLFFVLIFFFSCDKKNNDQQLHDKTDKASVSIHTEKEHKDHEKNKTYYTCSMHPQIRENKDGKCPICHMNLTKIIESESESEDENISKNKTAGLDQKDKLKRASLAIGKIKLRKSQLEHFRPDYFSVIRMKMNKKIRLLGSVFQSEEKESIIPARVGGRVEKVYVQSTGSFVRIGDPVVDIYSPKLITAGEEYILARQSFRKSRNREFKDLLEQSQERLRLWGVKKKQFEKWYQQGQVPRQITLYSPTSGIVRKKLASVGKYFEEGQNFFELSDLSEVWVEMDVYEHEASLIKLGQKIDLEFTSLPGEIIAGEIDFVSPVLNEQSRTLKIRTTISNSSGKLRPGMVATATLNIAIEGQPLIVPRSAIIDTGKRKVVWVKKSETKFIAKIIYTGHESDGHVEIKKGLIEGEEIVVSGNFLLDAQAQLFGGYEDIAKK